VTIRPCRRDEVDAVLELWREADPQPGATDHPAAVGVLLDYDRGALLVAEHETRIVGTLIAAWDGWRGNMYRLAVTPGARRTGIATALVREGERRLRSRGGRRVTALVDRDDATAVGLWESVG
jgi:ribosomal protein S18 acetylase RimI-like enzyme